LKSIHSDFNFYLQAQPSRPQGYPEPAKLSSASVCASAFAVNEMAKWRDVAAGIVPTSQLTLTRQRILLQSAVMASPPILLPFESALPFQFPVIQLAASRAPESVQPDAHNNIPKDPSQKSRKYRLNGPETSTWGLRGDYFGAEAHREEKKLDGFKYHHLPFAVSPCCRVARRFSCLHDSAQARCPPGTPQDDR
jgi:hypothetical protein